MQEQIKKLLYQAISDLQHTGSWPVFGIPEIAVEYARDEKFGDYATNVALVVAKKIGKNPMEIAEDIVKKIKCHSELVEESTQNKNHNALLKVDPSASLRFAQDDKKGIFEKIEVAPPGYINFYLSPKYFQDKIAEINKLTGKFGQNKIGAGQKVLLEFISANPTGPIHLGNGRGGPTGDALANVLEKSGYVVEREFYVNDFGNQVEVLGHSILQDDKAQYQGDYVQDLVVKLRAHKKKMEEPLLIGNWAAGIILETLIKPTCEKSGIHFDTWFSEKSLHSLGKVDEVIELLNEKKLTYEKDEALWYKSTEFGDDKDRVLVKTDGNRTYVAVDLAYHQNKLDRNFDKLINIQGADHFKESETVRNFLEQVLGAKGKLETILSQFVRVMKDGEEVKMSKRKGVYFALDDLIEEVGRDAVRFIFLSYAPTTHINFDINLAKERSEKNPVYYVQYAHARINSIIAKSKIQNPNCSKSNPCLAGRQAKSKIQDFKLDLLVHPKELSLMRELNKFPELVAETADNYAVHRLPQYAIKLADKFHSFYAACRVIDEENLPLSGARLNLVNAVRIVLVETLRLMGVSAPSRM